MNEKTQYIWNLIEQSKKLSQEEKDAIAKSLKDADKEISIASFKIERLEKVKYTTTVLLEQTIEELESKRKSIEEQKRDLQIEAALERVRAIAMGMREPGDMLDICRTIAAELKELDINEIRNVQTAIFYEAKGTYTNYEFYVKHDKAIVTETEFRNHQVAEEFALQMIKGPNSFFAHSFTGKEVKEWLAYQKTTNVFIDTYLETATSLSYYWYSLGQVALGISTYEPLTLEQQELFKRFRNVFELAYRRYLDIEKAQAQAKESQIQLALERVRARTMAMQHSDELSETAYILFQQFRQLGEAPIQITIGIFNEEQNVIEFRVTGGNGSGSKIDDSFNASMDEPTLVNKIFRAWKQNKKSEIIILEGKELSEWIKYRNEISGKYAYETKVDLNDRRYASIGFFSKGMLSISTNKSPSEETIQILERFGSVFDLTYTRFLDLKNAEAQAREATIEAALEKVRGKAMAMHNSIDLSVTASMVFTELRKLGIIPIRCGVGLLNRESRKAQLYSATSSRDEDNLALVGWVMLSDHPVLENIYDTWLNNEEYYPELSNEELRSYYELLLSGLSVQVPSDLGQKQYGTFLPFSVGCLYAWSDRPYNEAEIKILKRFAMIIDLTFRRYIELQRSEANTREAVKQAVLDRVRAEIASMRTVTDLEKITPLIWNELTILGIPFIRCGVFIMDDLEKRIHTFLSTPDGKAIAAFHIPYNTPGNIAQVLSHWKNKENYIDHWDEKAFTEFADTLVKQGALTSSVQYLQTIPHGGFYLHFLPFLQGMLYVGNSTQLNEEEIKLIQSLAHAFSTAYARYEDFNKLEAAKKQVDSTLNELQATQKQLIQSEKMASLGELTAGIAHEIQNPLNFVNNFSEVSSELLQEMKTELDKGEAEAAKTIADDVKQNLEKILYHGKRADAIVKGMLQHSRSSSGQKELTDLNALADEYLRLAYHGLRAKDKSFNAKFETDLDKTIGKISIVPQDIGRVILNLINNAFYAVSEKKRQVMNGYDPTVTVKTRKTADKIFISVNDNGNGIPKKVLDKIYQPFFTTKPTGEGTGLGLSLSYDIITKGHGGQLKVKTKEGEGSEFTIVLPW